VIQKVANKVPKPNFLAPTAAKSCPIGALSPNLATVCLASREGALSARWAQGSQGVKMALLLVNAQNW